MPEPNPTHVVCCTSTVQQELKKKKKSKVKQQKTFIKVFGFAVGSEGSAALSQGGHLDVGVPLQKQAELPDGIYQQSFKAQIRPWQVALPRNRSP